MAAKKRFDLRDRYTKMTLGIWAALTITLGVYVHFYEMRTTDNSQLSALEYKQQKDAHRVFDYSPFRVLTYTAFGSLVIFMAVNGAMGAARRAGQKKKA